MSDHRPLRGLRGERVYLRPLEPEDADLVADWYADDRVRWLMGDPPISRARRRRRYDEAVTGDGDTVFRFVICRLHDDTPVGRADLFEVDRANGNCGFGIAIGDPAQWGQGLGGDAVNAIVDFVFGELRMERLWLDTDAHNARAQAAYRKAGFVEEGRFRHAWFQYGVFSDDIRMAILRDEWLALPRPKSWELVAAASVAPDGDGIEWAHPAFGPGEPGADPDR